jgi:hypothetical protein
LCTRLNLRQSIFCCDHVVLRELGDLFLKTTVFYLSFYYYFRPIPSLDALHCYTMKKIKRARDQVRDKIPFTWLMSTKQQHYILLRRYLSSLHFTTLWQFFLFHQIPPMVKFDSTTSSRGSLNTAFKTATSTWMGQLSTNKTTHSHWIQITRVLQGTSFASQVIRVQQKFNYSTQGCSTNWLFI